MQAHITIKRFLQIRDELSLANIRRSIWAVILLFPLTVIMGDLRYYDLKITVEGFQSYELMLYPLGIGWLVLCFIPQRFIFTLLRVAVICSVLVLPFQFFITDDIGKLSVYMAFQFFNGICAACAFSFFCFKLNNIERLFGMAMILFYYGLVYTIYREIIAVQEFYKTWLGVIGMALYLVVIFNLNRKKYKQFLTEEPLTNDGKSDKVDGAKLVIGLHIVYYTIMCMINYIEWAEKIVYSLPYGLGQFSSIVLIIFIMLIINRSALNIWIMYLVFSLFGLAILYYNSEFTHFSGSLIYGLGDGLGYIIIYYLCAGVIKQSKSIKMFRLYCLVFFIEYCFISGILSRIFDAYEGSNHYIALGVVLVLCSCCFLLIPLMQKKLFDADWTDGLRLSDIPEHASSLVQTEKVNNEENLGLSLREKEIFTLMLKNMPLKTIAIELGLSFHTVNSHYRSIYRKLGINNKGDLFIKYGGKTN